VIPQSSRAGNTLVIPITITSPVIISAPVVYLSYNSGYCDVFYNTTGTGTPAQQILLSTASTLEVTQGNFANQTLTVNFSSGDPLPAGQLIYSPPAGGTNALNIIGSIFSDAVGVTGSTVTISNVYGSAAIAYSGVSSITFNGNGGNDTLTQQTQPGGEASLVFYQPTALDTLDIDAGTFTVPADAPGSGALDYTLGTVSIASGAKLVLAASDVPADQTVLAVNRLTVAGTVDITDNIVEINYTPGSDPITTIQGYLNSGYNSDEWTGTGITSSNAAANPGLYAVGYVDGNLDAGTPAAANQILIKNTLAGDANLDGVVNFADLLVVAQNFNHTLDTHGNPIDWADGDFNYDGKVNFADLLLVAQNFNKRLAAGQSVQTPLSSSPPAEAATETATPAPAADAQPIPATTNAAAPDPVLPAPMVTTNLTASNPALLAATSLPAAPEISLPPTTVMPAPAVTSSVPVLNTIAPAPAIPTELTASPTLTAASIVDARISHIKTIRTRSAPEARGATNITAPSNVYIRSAKPRLVVAMPPALPTDGITNDALAGVWNDVSTAGNLLFSDSRHRDLLR
jgi:hypothetical protein